MYVGSHSPQCGKEVDSIVSFRTSSWGIFHGARGLCATGHLDWTQGLAYYRYVSVFNGIQELASPSLPALQVTGPSGQEDGWYVGWENINRKTA